MIGDTHVRSCQWTAPWMRSDTWSGHWKDLKRDFVHQAQSNIIWSKLSWHHLWPFATWSKCCPHASTCGFLGPSEITQEVSQFKSILEQLDVRLRALQSKQDLHIEDQDPSSSPPQAVAQLQQQNQVGSFLDYHHCSWLVVFVVVLVIVLVNYIVCDMLQPGMMKFSCIFLTCGFKPPMFLSKSCMESWEFRRLCGGSIAI